MEESPWTPNDHTSETTNFEGGQKHENKREICILRNLIDEQWKNMSQWILIAEGENGEKKDFE